uniref:inorganic diphosphatase n=1 Tax=viral metagenome TaxID=1070528 RepID=A0A6C0JEI5_9ZZZZ
MDKKVQVYIEIEKGSNIKYELNKETNKLEVDRILPDPYYYPYSYGFITNTLAMDEDELDALIITEKNLEKDKIYDVHIVGVLIMSDEKGLDEKVLCVLEEDYGIIKDLEDLSQETRDNIHWFFSNYKSNTPGKWSKVDRFDSKEKAISIYNKSCFL